MIKVKITAEFFEEKAGKNNPLNEWNADIMINSMLNGHIISDCLEKISYEIIRRYNALQEGLTFSQFKEICQEEFEERQRVGE